MDNDEVRAVFDRQMREGLRPESPGARVERVGGAGGSGAGGSGVGAVVRQVGSVDDWNGVVWSDLDAGSADAVIAEQAAYFAGLGLEVEWKLYGHDRPADLGARLLAAGFVPEPQETLLVAEVARQAAEPVLLPEGVRLVPVTDAEGVDLVARVHTLAFEEDVARFRNRLLAQLTGDPDRVVAVVAMAGDEPVCAARMELHTGTDFASLWGGGTAPGWRGKGIYRALIAHRARIAAERGYRYLQVDASDQSRPILERLGFAVLSTTTPYLRGADATER
ncbi:GNAT family N-acetyltransferase [Streptacidiphilus sp. PAMC 29251]